MAGKLKKSKGKNSIKLVKKTVKPKAKAKVSKKSAVVAKKTVKTKQSATAKIKSKAKVTSKAKAVKTKIKAVVNKSRVVAAKNPKGNEKNKNSGSKVAKKQSIHNQDLAQDKDAMKHDNLSELNVNLDSPVKFQPYDIDATEDYMNEQQLQHFASILESWKRDLMLEVDNTITEMKEADILADPNDRATQEETFNLELRTRDRERKLIRKIESALTKIAEQKYGYCDSCGVEIGIRRLEARPTASLCIECKTLSEIREKRS